MFTRKSLIPFLTLPVVAAACGGDGATAEPTPTDVPATTIPSTPATAPPTTDSGPDATASTSIPPPADDGLPTQFVEIDDGAFGSVSAMADASELVVLATVTDTTSLGRPNAATDPDADEFVGLTFEIDETLRGSPDDVRMAWRSYDVGDDGERAATVLLNGIEPPAEGDRFVLFLRRVDGMFADVMDGFPTHELVMLDGIGLIDGDTVVAGDTISGTTTGLVGTTLESLRDTV